MLCYYCNRGTDNWTIITDLEITIRWIIWLIQSVLVVISPTQLYLREYKTIHDLTLYPSPTVRIYCRMRTNVKYLKFVPILFCWRVKSFFFFSWYEYRKNTTQFYLVFHTNEQEWTELSKKIVRLCRNQHVRFKTKANLHEYEHELTRIST